MADEKSKPGVPPPGSPFGDDDTDWDSELAAWDAALPIGDKKPGERRPGPRNGPSSRPVPAAAAPAPAPAPPEAPPRRPPRPTR
jgi:hypothetical protein